MLHVERLWRLFSPVSITHGLCLHTAAAGHADSQQEDRDSQSHDPLTAQRRGRILGTARRTPTQFGTASVRPKTGIGILEKLWGKAIEVVQVDVEERLSS